MSRRGFLGLAAGAGAASALGLRAAEPGHLARAPVRFASEAGPQAGATAQRCLVVLELDGGNDGLSMVVPFADPAYRALRPRTGLDPAVVNPVDQRVGLHPNLRRIAARGPAVVVGVGVASPDLSHFEMRRRWWTGEPDGTSRYTTGFLGRLCDTLGDPAAPAVGVSLGPGPTPALDAQRVVTLSLDPSSGGNFPLPGDGGPLDRAWMAANRDLATADAADPPSRLTSRRGAAQALTFTDLAGHLPEPGTGFPTTDTGNQLKLAAQLLAADQGIRIIHVPLTGDYDTHTTIVDRYPRLMTDLDGSVDAFVVDLQRRGLADRVLIATTSEFGRRAAENGSGGLDHGAASSMLLLGPVIAGVRGELPRLDRLDSDGNLAATTNLTEYYATLAESWLGVPADGVLPGRPRPLGEIVQARDRGTGM
ncbi:MAG: DUF1501 domain-containing protein [Actinomycetota bacterium]|nr:DUF1501 domain-containing protein [Actinomycetota bacterium]